ncbi:MAG: hypothetical protein E7478_10535 [Ruminococcaceae bacterium]|nr:hypothetical protein [Oscillospiraceae bacterium]
MNKYEKAIKYFEEHMKVLDNHCKHGGDFALEAREHTQTALEALRKQSDQVSFCIAANCTNDCLEFSNGPVCEHYADKVDEICRIHEED